MCLDCGYCKAVSRLQGAGVTEDRFVDGHDRYVVRFDGVSDSHSNRAYNIGFHVFYDQEPGSSGLWAAAKMVFLLPIGVMFIVVGFTPGLPTNIETDVEVFGPDQGH